MREILKLLKDGHECILKYSKIIKGDDKADKMCNKYFNSIESQKKSRVIFKRRSVDNNSVDNKKDTN